MVPLVIGTGFLGRAIVDCFRRHGVVPLHTCHLHRCFADSVRFDLFSDDIQKAIDLTRVDCVVVASLIENSDEMELVIGAMARLFAGCRDKRIIYLSTDAVFDGKQGMYSEEDAPHPVTRYGKNKYLCEQVLVPTASNYCILRASYIYGFSLGQLDRRLRETRDVLAGGGSVCKYTDMFKSPIEVNQLAQLVTLLRASPFRGVLHGGGPRTSVYDFFHASLGALGVSTTRLLPDAIPDCPVPTRLRDTSLNGGLMQRTFGMRPAKPEDMLQSDALSGCREQDDNYSNGRSR